jgi:hypothetical protein
VGNGVRSSIAELSGGERRALGGAGAATVSKPPRTRLSGTLRVAARLPRWRHLLLDLAPAALLVTAVVISAQAITALGGPVVEPPSGQLNLSSAFLISIPWGLVALLVALLVSRGRAAWLGATGKQRPSPPFAAARRTLPRLLPRAVAVVGGVALIRVLMPFFIGFKRAVPEFHPFGAVDPVLIRLERALHFGVDPWRLLQPIVGRPWITAAIDLIYVNWYMVCVVAFVALTFWLRGPDRTQFVLSFASAWVFLGILLATALSSVGPCFMDRYFGGESAFTAQMAYLASVNEVYPLNALVLQNGLWDSYLSGGTGLVSGIAAMPSIHVALPTLFAVAAWRRARTLSVLLWLYTTVIVIGSVHLAWHYALDGYVSIVLIFPLWWACGKVSAWWYARTRAWRWGWERAAAGSEPSRG